MAYLWMLLPILVGYFLGAVPFGLVIGKTVKGIDIRDVGSGNIGTANAVRALGPFWGGLVFVCDTLKGVIPVVLTIYLPKIVPGVNFPVNTLHVIQVLAGTAAILGHNYSCFLNFKGGKGIATSFGVFLTLEYRAALLAIVIWGIAIALTKYSSLGSLLGSLSVPILMLVFHKPLPYVIFAFLAVAMAFYKHRENIDRLLKGKERKITDKPAAPPEEEESAKEEGDSEGDKATDREELDS